jgi:hypothetical protein
MYKKILMTISIAGIISISMAGFYYIAIHMPQKQQKEIEKLKLELEIKIEQEKTEQAKIEQGKQQLEIEKQDKLIEEENKQAEIEEQQQRSTELGLKKCLDSAEAVYKSKFDELIKIFENSNVDIADVQGAINNLQSQRNQARNECYK